jgi:hypothetical protein
MAKATNGELIVEEVDVTEITPDQGNLNEHSSYGEALVEKSLGKHGFRFAGTLDKHRTIVHGNNRFQKAGEAGFDRVVIIRADPHKQYYLQYEDLDLTDEENAARELSILANRTAQASIHLSPERLMQLDQEGRIDLSEWYSHEEIALMELNLSGDVDLDGFSPPADANVLYRVVIDGLDLTSATELASEIDGRVEQYRG